MVCGSVLGISQVFPKCLFCMFPSSELPLTQGSFNDWGKTARGFRFSSTALPSGHCLNVWALPLQAPRASVSCVLSIFLLRWPCPCLLLGPPPPLTLTTSFQNHCDSLWPGLLLASVFCLLTIPHKLPGFPSGALALTNLR